MSDFRISAQRGSTIGFLVTVTRLGVAVDLTQAGMKLIVTGKLRTDDVAPVFVKDYFQAGGAPNGGILVGGAASPPQATNVADVEIPPNEAGIVALTKTSYIQVDAVLIEPNGRETPVANGVIKLRVAPGS